MQIEKLEDWSGQNVIDKNDEKIGKLADVYYERGGSEAALACVKSGALGRKLRAVPLEGAQATRDQIRLAYTKDEIKNGPRVDGGADLAPDQREAIATHYGADLSSGSFESAQARSERAAREEELTGEIDDLEAEAAKKREQARRGADQAQSSFREADDLDEQRRRLQDESRRL